METNKIYNSFKTAADYTVASAKAKKTSLSGHAAEVSNKGKEVAGRFFPHLTRPNVGIPKVTSSLEGVPQKTINKLANNHFRAAV